MSIEFLFEKKHWKKILKTIAPSLRLKIEKLYSFDEPQVWSTEGNDRLSLGLSGNNYYLKGLSFAEKKEVEDALVNGIILLIRELQIGPRDLSLGGVQVHEDDALTECISEFATMQGFVYLIRNQELHKIGITTNLLRRMEQLKPDELLDTVKCKNFRELEKQIHHTFKECRIPQTEYFRFTPKQLSLVHNMMHKLAEIDFL